MYEVRARNWWIDNPSWPNGREPGATPWDQADLIATVETQAEAQAIAQEFNATHEPGHLSYKAEFDEV